MLNNLNNFSSHKKSTIGFSFIFSILVFGMFAIPLNSASADDGAAHLLVSNSLSFLPDPAVFGGLGGVVVEVETTSNSETAEDTVIHLEGAPGLILDPVLTTSTCVEPYFPNPAPPTGFVVDCFVGDISPDSSAGVFIVFELGPSGNDPSSFLEITTTNLVNDIQYLDPQFVEFTCNTCPDPLVITSPADNSILFDNTPNIHGDSQGSHNISLNILGVGVNNTLTTTSNPSGIFTFNNISPALPDGIYTITATDTDALDANGNPLPVADSITITIDTGTFIAFDPSLNNSITNDVTPTIFGTAEPNSQVTVIIDGNTLVTNSTLTGTWSVTSPGLDDAVYSVDASIIDAAGNTASAPTINITVDSTITLTIISHSNGEIINNNTPVFFGSADPDSLVEVSVNGTSIGSDIATTGTWSIPSPLLLDGVHFLNVTGIDLLNNTSSILISIIIDSTTFVTIDPSLNGTSTNDITPNIFGTAEPSSFVEVFAGGLPIGTTTAGIDGTWNINSLSLSNGPHTIFANTTDVAGNTASTSPIILTVDTISPLVTISSTAAPITNTLPIPFTANFTEPVFDLLESDIVVMGPFSVTPGSLSTADNIAYTFTVNGTANGSIPVKILQNHAHDAAGNGNLMSNTATVIYDDVSPIPVISSSTPLGSSTNISPIPFTITFNESTTGLLESEISIFNGTVTPGSLSTTNNLVYTFSVIPVSDGIVNATIPFGVAQDQAGNLNVLSNTYDVVYDTTISIAILSHVNGDVTNDNTPLFFGTSESGANIEVTYDTPGIFYAANVTDGTGIWQTVDESNPIPDGPHLITANATDAAGNTVSISITIDTMPPMVVLTTTSPSPTNTSPIFFNATFSEIVTDLKEDEIIVTGGTVDEDSLSPDDDDETLFYTFTVTPSGQGLVNATIPFGVAEDLATNLNTASNNLGVLYDSVTSVAINSPPDGSTTSDNTPTFSGNTESGALVKVFSGTTLLGNTTASGTGSWSFTPGSALPDGVRTIKAEATDALGNQASKTIFVVIDTIPPVITLNGSNPQIIPLNGLYTELNATTDDGSPVVIDSSAVDVNTLGSYFVFYNSTDAVGNVATLVNRTVNVVDANIPVITLLGNNPQNIQVNHTSNYIELNATAFDDEDGDISGDIVIDSSAVNGTLIGIYSVTYDVTDNANNTAVQQVRTVNVIDTIAPTILLDSYEVTIELGGVYNPANANATDNDPAYVEDIAVGGDPVDVNVSGVYFVSFSTTDPSGNDSVVNQVVTITDTTKPVITLNGVTPITLESGVDAYTELGANVTDNDPAYSEAAIIGGDTVDANTVGVYTVTYDAPADAAGNTPLQITRTVNVVDTLPPVITLTGANPQFIELGAGYTELGATAIDTEDGDLTGSIIIDISDFTDAIGSYNILYNVTDSSSNSVQEIRNATVQDTTAPTFNVSGNATDYNTALVAGQPYTVGAVLDIVDLSLPTITTIVGDDLVDVNTPGVYLVTYTVEDAQGNSFTIIETVTISAGDAPVITLTGANPQFIELGAGYTELGATAIDTEDGDLTGSIIIDISDFTDAIGSYNILYNVTDSSSNSVQEIRNATVQDTTAPTFNVSGNATDYNTALVAGQPYTVGAVLDIVDLSLPTITTIVGDDLVDVNTPGVYLVTYTVEDAQGNSFTIIETVTISAGDAPVITLTGANPQFIELGAGYTELGATAIDTEDGDLTGSIIIDISDFTDAIGSYNILYNVTDSSSNSVQEIRNATVQDTTAPTFNVSGNATDYNTALVAGQPYTVGAVLDIVDLSLPTITTIVGDDLVDVNTPGVYLVTYTVEDAQGNSFTIIETVTISAGDAPVITLTGANPQFIELGAGYTELGATAIDTEDGDLTGSIIIDISDFTDAIGSYNILYNVTDSSSNSVQEIRNATVQDTTAPTFNVSGNATDYNTALVAGQPYTVGAVLDIVDLSLPTITTIVGDDLVDVNTPGVYLVTYTVEDAQGNSFTIIETVTISAGDAPVITLTGANPQFIELGAGYTELGATAIDTEDGDLTGSIIIDISDFTDAIGSYNILYNVTDSSSNSVQEIRNATVQDTTAPTFNVSGNATDYNTALVAGQPYTVGAVLDIVDLSLPTITTIVGDDLVDVNTPGVYLVTYTVEDAQGNSFTIIETVTISAGDAPVITLTGANPQFIELGAGYTELGATAIDTEDGDLTGSIIIDISDFTDAIGSYNILYNVTDSSSNSVQEIRNATVQDTTAPTFNVSGNATDYNTALVAGQPYTVGAVLDIVDLHLPTITTIVGDDLVDVNTPGVYLVTYTVEDAQGNSFTIIETVTISAGDAPVITLTGANPQFIELGAGYTELGATAIDTEDGDLTGSIIIDISDFTDAIGSYNILYNVTDSSSNSVQEIRNATVQDTTAPTFNVSGNATDYNTALVAGQPYTVGAVLDIVDLSLPTITTIVGDDLVDVNTPGVYLVTYTVEDAQGNSFTIIETVTISAGDAPVITLTGANPQFIELGAGYTELGATAIDTEDGDLTGSIIIDISDFTDAIGSYNILYNVTDSSSNSVQEIRNATVQDTTAPTFNVSGNATDYNTALVAGQPYTVGAVLDIVDLSLPTITTIVGDDLVDVNTPGVYLVTYTVEDAQGNSFTIIETVTISAGDAPVITLTGANPQFIELGAGYTELGATAIDTEDGDLTGSIIIDISDFTDAIGSYNILYNVTDSSSNSVQEIRNATVQDTTAPTFNVSGNATDYNTALVAGQPYTVGAVLDIVDLSLPTITTIVGDDLVDVNTPGVYLVTYTVEDAQGNSFTIIETVTISAGDAPVITLTGANPQFIELGAGYTELGATAIDTEDGDLTGSIIIDISDFTDAIGSYNILYNVTDSSSNSVQEIRNATVQDTTAPTFNVSGNATDYNTALVAGQPYTVGAVLDIVDLSLPTITTIVGDDLVDVNTPGVYLVTYTVEDAQGNSFTIIETVTISAGDAPVITLTGANPQFIELGAGYTELGATAIDTEDGDLTGSIIIDISDFTDAIGSYNILYNVTDSSSNSVQEIRNATVQDTTAPTFNVSGNATDYNTALVAGQPYTVGAVLDIVDLSLPTITTIVGDDLVDVNTPGVYLVTYTVEDAQGNSFTIIETVTISAGDAPVITLTGANPQFIELGAGYTELGATAIDTEDGDLTGSIIIDISDFTDAIGSYNILYNVTDSSSNSVQEIRNATVQDTTAPTFNVSGNATDYNTALVAGQPYTVGAVLDIVDLSLPTITTIVGDDLVDVNTPGVYLVTYTVEDAQGNSFTIIETVTISAGDAPVITLTGANPQFIELGAGYTELGATAIDTEDGDLTGSIIIDISDFTDAIGSYNILYNVTDSSSNSVQEIRNATVQDTTAPTFNVSGNATDYNTALVAGQPYTVGAVLDIVDLSLPTITTIVGDDLVDVNTPGVYLVTYTVEDAQGNSFTIIETVTISAGDAPVITLTGANPQFIELGAGYTELGATAIDTEDGDLTGSIIIDISDFTDAIGSYNILYNVTDSSSNSVQEIRNATVQDTTAPTFNVSGNATDYNTALVAGQPYTVGAVLDIVDLSLPTITTIVGDDLVDVNTPGVYLVTYTVEDAQGNSFTIIETVTISAGDAPVITLTGANPQFIELGAGYTELGATAIDTEDGDLTGSIIIDISDFTDAIGSYNILYNVTDSSSNSVQEIRNATVQDTTAPTFNVSGNATDYNTALVAGQPYTVGAVLDIVDLSLPTITTIVGDDLVDVNTPGVYLVTYTVEDAQGNSFTIIETVTISAGDAPVITLTGANPQFIELGAGYTELGATAIDTEDGDLTGSIIIDISDFTDAIGSYNILYNVTDSSSNSVQEIRNATVQDTTAPTFNVSGNATDYNTALVAGQPYTVGAVLDIVDLSLPTITTIVGDDLVDVNTPGVYLVTYTVEDAQGNSFTIIETVTISAGDAPVITLTGANPQFIELGAGYTELGATAIDTEDGDLTGSIIIDISDFTDAIGSYNILYNVTDSSSNSVQEIRNATVQDTTAPTFNVSGNATDYNTALVAGQPYTVGAVLDIVDLSLPTITTIVGDDLVDVNTPGVYLVTYTVEDAQGNSFTIIETVTISAGDAPVITLTGANPQFIELGAGYTELGATAIDTEDGDLTGSIIIDISDFTDAIGSYNILYNVTDSSSNSVQEIRNATVQDTTAPTFNVSGNATDYNTALVAGQPYTVGAVLDIVDLSLPTITTIVGDDLVDVNTPGVYLVTYTVEDAQGNSFTIIETVTILVNSSPVLNVIEPISPITETEGTLILFNATATDAEDGVITSDITWTSDLDGPLHTGGSFTTAGLTVGTHTITVSITDSFGNTTTEDIIVTIEALVDASPVLNVIEPISPITETEGTLILFNATATDAEDGVITSDITWTSDLDGPLHTGGSFTTAGLTVGTHTITVSITDSFGNTTTEDIIVTIEALVDASPVLNVIEPISPITETEGTLILFNATATDAEDGVITSDITWTSDLDGPLHTGGSFTTAGLTVGTHTITVSITDSFGNTTTEDIIVTIEALVDASPVLNVIEPISPITETEGTLILFNATATDAEDGVITSDITWTSDLDGPLHTGGSFTTAGLTVGTHTITVSITDSFGNTTTEDIIVTIEALVDASPVLNVIEPISPITETEGTLILFNATATDAEDGVITSDITWTSDLDGPLHTGGSFTTAGLTVGTHTITVSITDSFGNTTTEDIIVTIEALVDASPVLNVIEPISPITETEGTLILFNATATDAEDGVITSDITWTSDLDGPLHTGGSFTTAGLTVGTHTITVSITDSFGNTTTEDIIVTIEEGVVLSVQAQKLAIIDELKDLKPLAESSKTVKDIDQAIKRVQKSLDSKYWEDENTLDPKQGHHSIHEEEKAVKKLMEIIDKQNESESFLNSIQDIIDHITLIDKTFAEVAIEEAEAANTDGQFTKQIEKAIEQFEKGLEDEHDGKFDKAIHHYEKAWVIISIINLLDDLDDYVDDDKDEDKEEKDDDKEDKVDDEKKDKDEGKEEKDDDKEDKVDEDKEDKDNDKEDKYEDKEEKDDDKEEKDDDSSVNNAPVISLLGDNPQIIQLDDSYLELNATATDIEDGDLTGSIMINSTSVNTAVLGNYTVTYDVSDSLLLPAVQQTRTVEVVNGTIGDEEKDDDKEEKDDDSSVNNAPVISLLGDNPQIIQLDDSYLELNATATDIEDGDLTGSIMINSTSVNTAVLGNYTVTYDVSDSLLLPAVQQTRTVEVVNGTIGDEDKDDDKEDKKDKSKDDDKEDKVEDKKKDKDEDKEDKKDKSKDDDKEDKVEDKKKDKDEDKEDKKDKSKDDDKEDKVEDKKKDKDEDKEDKKDKSKDDDKEDKVEDKKKDKDEDKEDKKDKSKDDDKEDKVEDKKKDKDEDKEDKKDKSKDDDKEDKVEDKKKDKDEDKEDKKDKSKDDDKEDKVEDKKKDKDEDKKNKDD